MTNSTDDRASDARIGMGPRNRDWIDSKSIRMGCDRNVIGCGKLWLGNAVALSVKKTDGSETVKSDKNDQPNRELLTFFHTRLLVDWVLKCGLARRRFEVIDVFDPYILVDESGRIHRGRHVESLFACAFVSLYKIVTNGRIVYSNKNHFFIFC